MTTLPEFLLARYDELETKAKAAQEEVRAAEWMVADSPYDGILVEPATKARFLYARESSTTDHMESHDPAYVLADIAAKRAVIAAASFYVDYYPDWPPVCEVAGNEGQPCNVTDAFFKHQAALFSDHPDYREEWRPA